MSFFQRLYSVPFPPVSCSFPEPLPDPQGFYNLLERQPENSWPWEGNTLFNIQPPNPTQYWSHWRSWGCPNSSLGGPRRSSRLDLSRDRSLKCCHASTCSGICQFRGPRRSSCLDLPRDPILGRPSRLDLPGDSISRRLSHLSLPGDLHPDPGTPGSQVATVLGRMNLHHIYSHLQ